MARWDRRPLRHGRGLLPPPSPPPLGQDRCASEDRFGIRAGAPRAAAVHSIGSRRMLVAATIIDEALADSRRCRPGRGASCSGRLRARRQSRRALWHGGMCLPIVGTTQPLVCCETRARCSLSNSSTTGIFRLVRQVREFHVFSRREGHRDGEIFKKAHHVPFLRRSVSCMW